MPGYGERCLREFAPFLGNGDPNLAEQNVAIRDPQVRDLVVLCFEKIVPAYFWERAASKSHKYHPALVGREPGGLVIHTKMCAWWALQYSRCMDPGTPVAGQRETDSPHRDIYIAAGLLHDCMKDGDPELEGQKRDYRAIGGGHGIDMCNAIYNRVLNQQTPHRWQQQLLLAVATHMGIWTSDPQYRPESIEDPEDRLVCRILHAGDYSASRKADTLFTQLAA